MAFIFNQQFFTDLREETGIDLENIVYYKDETHYFVMTAKKHSLLKKGVIKEVCMIRQCKCLVSDPFRTPNSHDFDKNS